MLSKALILLTLLSLTPYHRDTENWEAREARLALVAESIHAASNRATCTKQADDCKVIWPGSQRSLAILLITQARYETNLSHHIHDNNCRLELGECDSKKKWDSKKKAYTYTQQSFSLWQIKKYRDIPDADWEKIQSGREGTHVAAWHAARRLSSAYRACGSIHGAISRYAVGNSCIWSDSKSRESTWKSLLFVPEETLLTRIDLRKKAVLRRERVGQLE